MITGLGYLQIFIPEWQMRKLWHRTYRAALTMTDSYSTRQPMLALLPLQYGGVTF